MTSGVCSIKSYEHRSTSKRRRVGNLYARRHDCAEEVPTGMRILRQCGRLVRTQRQEGLRQVRQHLNLMRSVQRMKMHYKKSIGT